MPKFTEQFMDACTKLHGHTDVSYTVEHFAGLVYRYLEPIIKDSVLSDEFLAKGKQPKEKGVPEFKDGALAAFIRLRSRAYRPGDHLTHREFMVALYEEAGHFLREDITFKGHDVAKAPTTVTLPDVGETSVAQIAKWHEHSVTLNRMIWSMAVHMGDVQPDEESAVLDPQKVYDDFRHSYLVATAEIEKIRPELQALRERLSLMVSEMSSFARLSDPGDNVTAVDQAVSRFEAFMKYVKARDVRPTREALERLIDHVNGHTGHALREDADYVKYVDSVIEELDKLIYGNQNEVDKAKKELRRALKKARKWKNRYKASVEADALGQICEDLGPDTRPSNVAEHVRAARDKANVLLYVCKLLGPNVTPLNIESHISDLQGAVGRLSLASTALQRDAAVSKVHETARALATFAESLSKFSVEKASPATPALQEKDE